MKPASIQLGDVKKRHETTPAAFKGHKSNKFREPHEDTREKPTTRSGSFYFTYS